jgi:hypothetical protein
MSEVKASYRVDWCQGGFVHITDLNVGKSVTNDAEAVVREIFANYGNQRIIYVDTMGCTDELLHSKGVFTGFAPGCGDAPPDPRP